MDIIERRLQVGKADSFKANISRWLSNQEIESSQVVPDSLLTVSAIANDESGVKFIATGVIVGLSTVKITVSTATRQRCFELGIKVVEGC